MGNVRSKNTLLGIVKKWEESSPYGNDYQSYSCKINGVSIHRLKGEYYVESNFATIGPMNKEQLIMISKKSPNFQLRTAYTQLASSGDTSDLQLHDKKLLVTLKNYSRKLVKPDNVLTMDENNDLDNINKFQNNISKEMVSICSPDDKSSITNISTNIELCSEELKSPTNKVNIILNNEHKSSKSSKDLRKCLRRTSKSDRGNSKSIKFTMKKFEISKTFPKNIIDKKTLQKYGRLKNRKSNITSIKALNLSSTKKMLKRQYNQKLLEEYKEIQMLNLIKKEIELKSTGDSLQKCEMNYQATVPTVGFSEPISKEKFRYTAFVKADSINWCKQKSLIRRLKLGFEEKYGCVVNLGDEVIEFRGNVIYTVNIEGKDKISVIKCRNSLPFELRANLILSKNPSEESSCIISEKWKSLTPYHPKVIQKLGSKAIKLSY